MILLVILFEVILSIIVLTYPLVVITNYYSFYKYINVFSIILFVFILFTIINAFILRNKYLSDVKKRNNYFNLFCILLSIFFAIFNDGYDDTQLVILLFLYNLMLNINDIVYYLILKDKVFKRNSCIIFNIVIYCFLLIINVYNFNNFLNIHALFGIPLFVNIFIKKISLDIKKLNSYVYLFVALSIFVLNVFFPTILNKCISYPFINTNISKELYYIMIDSYNKKFNKNVSYLYKLSKNDFNGISDIYLNYKTIYNIDNLNNDLNIILKNRKKSFNVWIKNMFIEELNINAEGNLELNLRNSEIKYLYFKSKGNTLNLFESNVNKLESKYQLYINLYDSNIDESIGPVKVTEKNNDF